MAHNVTTTQPTTLLEVMADFAAHWPHMAGVPAESVEVTYPTQVPGAGTCRVRATITWEQITQAQRHGLI